MFLEDMYRVYPSDIRLLHSLGVDTSEYESKPLPPQKEFKLGTVQGDGYSIELFVSAFPACFYKAIIYSKDSNKTFTVSTGSGCLEGYWDTFLNFANGMLVVEEIVDHGKHVSKDPS